MIPASNFTGMRVARGLAAAVAAALTFALPASAQSAPAAPAQQSPAGNPLKIGVIGPFTGASADFGVQMLNGIQQAVDEI
ncbi:MAG: ABC transporter substrate-binding protein, partial [Polaromonas sp.]